MFEETLSHRILGSHPFSEVPWYSRAAPIYAQCSQWMHRPVSLLFQDDDRTYASFLMHHLLKDALCIQRGPEGACDRCASCLLWLGPQHPDLTILSNDVGVEQVRQFQSQACMTPHIAPLRWLYIAPTARWSRAAEQAFLKVLEEPSDYQGILWLTEHTQTIAPTLRSRCIPIILPLPHKDLLQQWLKTQSLPLDAIDRLGSAYPSPAALFEALTGTEPKILERLVAHLQSCEDVSHLRQDFFDYDALIQASKASSFWGALSAPTEQLLARALAERITSHGGKEHGGI